MVEWASTTAVFLLVLAVQRPVLPREFDQRSLINIFAVAEERRIQGMYPPTPMHMPQLHFHPAVNYLIAIGALQYSRDTIMPWYRGGARNAPVALGPADFPSVLPTLGTLRPLMFIGGRGMDVALDNAWGPLESTGVWSVGDDARVAFRLQQVPAGDVNIAFRGLPYAPHPADEVRVDTFSHGIRVGGQVLTHTDMNFKRASVMHVVLPHSAIASTGIVDLNFHIARTRAGEQQHEPGSIGYRLISAELEVQP